MLRNHADGLADIVEKRRPVKPQIWFTARFLLKQDNVIQNLKGVGEVLLVAFAIYCFRAFQAHKFREELLQKPCLVHKAESRGRLFSEKHLVKLLHYSFTGKDLEAAGHPFHCIQGLRDYVEAKPCCKTDGAEHPQGVI